MSDVIYLYGFAPLDAPVPPPSLRGVGGAAVALHDVGGANAVVSAADFDPADLERRLDDIAWVGEQGLAHEAVVAWFVDHTDILPARLFSLHSSLEALSASVRAEAGAIEPRLRRFAGLREWDVKIAYDAASLERHAGDVSDRLRAIDAEIAAAAPGRQFLLRRRREELLRDELRVAAARLAAALIDSLAGHARDRRDLALGDAEAGTVVANAALLVHRDDDDALRRDAAARIADARALGLLVTFSGPWAPYRFMDDHVQA